MVNERPPSDSKSLGGGPLCYGLLMENKWLTPVVDVYREYFTGPAALILDVGTRDGDDAEFLARQLGDNDTVVVAIDANPDAVKVARSRYPSMIVLETAISNFIGTTSFLKITSDDKNIAGCSSMYVDKVLTEEIFADNTEAIEVEVTTLDQLIFDLGFGTERAMIDVIKVDIEGYTYQALEGLRDRIYDVKVMHLETEHGQVHSQHRNNIEVAQLMRSCGFVLHSYLYEWHGIQDQIWVNAELLSPAQRRTLVEVQE